MNMSLILAVFVQPHATLPLSNNWLACSRVWHARIATCIQKDNICIIGNNWHTMIAMQCFQSWSHTDCRAISPANRQSIVVASVMHNNHYNPSMSCHQSHEDQCKSSILSSTASVQWCISQVRAAVWALDIKSQRLTVRTMRSFAQHIALAPNIRYAL